MSCKIDVKEAAHAVRSPMGSASMSNILFAVAIILVESNAEVGVGRSATLSGKVCVLTIVPLEIYGEIAIVGTRNPKRSNLKPVCTLILSSGGGTFSVKSISVRLTGRCAVLEKRTRRRHVVVETTVLIISDNEKGLFPYRRGPNGFVDLFNQSLAFQDTGIRMLPARNFGTTDSGHSRLKPHEIGDIAFIQVIVKMLVEVLHVSRVGWFVSIFEIEQGPWIVLVVTCEATSDDRTGKCI